MENLWIRKKAKIRIRPKLDRIASLQQATDREKNPEANGSIQCLASHFSPAEDSLFIPFATPFCKKTPGKLHLYRTTKF
ncbi:Uncharacterized protein HZ326_30888 [Fusarium oxysporum f. sp. albedinis]|nr:Uncharacterized protein HZ326_30888 [Fusarium oxysporum f. sp. albedinis]